MSCLKETRILRSVGSPVDLPTHNNALRKWNTIFICYSFFLFSLSLVRDKPRRHPFDYIPRVKPRQNTGYSYH